MYIIYKHIINMRNHLSIMTKNLSVDIDKKSFWTQTPLQEFGFKCIANKHKICSFSKCKCFCHNFMNLS